ncbi:7-carboxy-7-deazaguanine synthase [Pollutimonas nitritireducens]|uniref:7-carboxy-7-deazaguanine synthase n=1 Tax=Pollutimonas nitritireducens TaxID=2045209 RepID=A0A2N4UBE9_9BURK|nr:7-carboxy-7-deazaguanine synthase [Pollutimonas nitritireducens]PLC52318.1 7-carboxy-7-deazaguanine synthase [Pollutimonas nitritireducens]
MTYSVKEIFLTLQGEGGQAGRPAVFCRFSGCNLWSGREQDRSTAQCQFCDTDFIGTDGTLGGKYKTADLLADRIESVWGEQQRFRFVVFTGGEPLLQLDAPLIDAIHARGFEIAVETNGTVNPPAGIDWLCTSPKVGTDWIVRQGQELKLVFPQPGIDPAHLEDLPFDEFWLQPMDGPDQVANTQAAIEYCLAHPRWRLSIQTHKLIGIR